MTEGRNVRIRSAEEAHRFVNGRQLDYVKVGVTDIDGILRGKYLSREKFLSAMEKGFGFCDVIVGWDSNDQLYDNVSFTGWHTAYPDVGVRILPDTGRPMPFEDGMPFFLCELAGEAEAICPRGLLRRVIARAADMGFDVSAAVEYEFFLFDETPEIRTRQGLPRPEAHDAGLLRLFRAALVRACRVLPRAAADVPRHGHGDRGPPHRDRARACSKPPSVSTRR